LDEVVAKDLEGDDGHDNMTAVLIMAKRPDNVKEGEVYV
jgi:hypothetical protein